MAYYYNDGLRVGLPMVDADKPRKLTLEPVFSRLVGTKKPQISAVIGLIKPELHAKKMPTLFTSLFGDPEHCLQ